MPDDQNTTQNQDSKENSIPASSQEPTEPVPVNTTGSEPSNMPLEPLEAPINRDTPVSLNNDNPQNQPISTPSPEETKTEVFPAEGGKTEGISEPAQAPEIRTAQIPVNEPLASEPEIKTEPKVEEIKSEPVPVIVPNKNKVLELLNKAKLAIQFRKRKKLDKVMTMFAKQTKITNDEVEKFMHVSDATAERYLNTLEKENKIKQSGKTGKGVSYSKI